MSDKRKEQLKQAKIKLRAKPGQMQKERNQMKLYYANVTKSSKVTKNSQRSPEEQIMVTLKNKEYKRKWRKEIKLKAQVAE